MEFSQGTFRRPFQTDKQCVQILSSYRSYLIRQYNLHLIIVIGRASRPGGKIDCVIHANSQNHCSFTFFLQKKLLKTECLVGTEPYMRYKWSFVVLISLNRFRFCIQVFKGLFVEIIYIYARIIISQELSQSQSPISGYHRTQSQMQKLIKSIIFIPHFVFICLPFHDQTQGPILCLPNHFSSCKANQVARHEQRLLTPLCSVVMV